MYISELLTLLSKCVCANNSEIYNPKEAIKAGFLDVIVPEDQLRVTAEKVATMFSKLNKKAHAATKVKVRQPHLIALKKAIIQDLKEEIVINA